MDELTVEKNVELQETVTTSGVRGAEAKDAILGKLYYRGSRQAFPGLTAEESETGEQEQPDTAAAKSAGPKLPKEPAVR